MRLDRLININQPVRGRDSFGGETRSYELWKQVWANRSYGIGNETQLANDIQRVAVQRVVYQIRWTAGMDATFEIEEDGVKHHIIAIEEIGRKHFLKITCEQRDNDR